MKTFTKKIPLAFFNILKEPLLVQNQTIAQKKALKLNFLQLESFMAWLISRASHFLAPKSIFF